MKQPAISKLPCKARGCPRTTGGNCSVGTSAKPGFPRQHCAISRGIGLATLPLAADGHICRPVDLGGDDQLAATRAPPPSNRRAGARRRLLQVMHLNRTAEAATLSASFAHEVSQPLVAVALSAERAEHLLRADLPQTGKLQEIVADIRQANSLAMNVIKNLGDLLKPKIDVQECDLNAAIEHAVQLFSPEANKRNIELRVNGIQRPLLVRADPVHLQQVILNLVINAMDAMSETAPDARKVFIHTALTGGGSTVEVSVRDSGAGIPEDKLSEIFDAFYTTKEQGTGLGLSIVRTIVETYGGKIWAENQVGGGAVVRFTLPLAR